jgi:hypothetical protein
VRPRSKQSLPLAVRARPNLLFHVLDLYWSLPGSKRLVVEIEEIGKIFAPSLRAGGWVPPRGGGSVPLRRREDSCVGNLLARIQFTTEMLPQDPAAIAGPCSSPMPRDLW